MLIIFIHSLFCILISFYTGTFCTQDNYFTGQCLYWLIFKHVHFFSPYVPAQPVYIYIFDISVQFHEPFSMYTVQAFIPMLMTGTKATNHPVTPYVTNFLAIIQNT